MGLNIYAVCQAADNGNVRAQFMQLFNKGMAHTSAVISGLPGAYNADRPGRIVIDVTQ